MYFNQSDSKAIASSLKTSLKFPVNVIVPLLKPIVPTLIEVERVGFTKNASNTPYVVYRINDRRCCTFVKRRWFFACVQLLLKLKDGIEAKIRNIRSSSDFGLIILTQENRQYIPSSYVNQFFTWLNCVTVERMVEQSASRDLVGIYPYRIGAYLKLKSLLNYTTVTDKKKGL